MSFIQVYAWWFLSFLLRYWLSSPRDHDPETGRSMSNGADA